MNTQHRQTLTINIPLHHSLIQEQDKNVKITRKISKTNSSLTTTIPSIPNVINNIPLSQQIITTSHLPTTTITTTPLPLQQQPLQLQTSNASTIHQTPDLLSTQPKATSGTSSTAPTGRGPPPLSAPSAADMIHLVIGNTTSAKKLRLKSLRFNYLDSLNNSVIDTVTKMWAASTVDSRNRLWMRLTEFATAQKVDMATSLDWLIPLFCEHTCRESKTLPSSRLTYAKHLVAIASRLSIPAPITRMYMSGLQASGAARPTHQAPAMDMMTVEILALAALQVPGEGERLYTLIYIMWKTASRFDEVSRLTQARITIIDYTTLLIDWSDQTKSSRQDPNRHDTWIKLVELTGIPQEVLRTIRKTLPKESQLLNHTVTWFDKWMVKALKSDKFSAHSIKAGSVSVLAELAASGHIPLQLVSLLAKHKMHEPLPIAKTTLIYIRDPLIKATLNESEKATALIPWLVTPKAAEQALSQATPAMALSQQEEKLIILPHRPEDNDPSDLM